MTVYADAAAVAVNVFEVYGGTSVTFTQGVTATAVTNAWKGKVQRSGEPGTLNASPTAAASEGWRLREENCRWRIQVSDLSGTTPAPGDKITDGAEVWTVDAHPDSVSNLLFGSVWNLETSRRVQR